MVGVYVWARACVCMWEVKARCGDGGVCDTYVYRMLSSLTLRGRERGSCCVYMYAMQLNLLMVQVCTSHVIYSPLDSLLLAKVWEVLPCWPED